MKKLTLLLLIIVCLAPSLGAKPAQAQTGATVTELLRSGDNGKKKNLVIIGDGFQAAQQTDFNNLVNTFVINGVFTSDVLAETKNAFNIYRINVNSVDSGVTQVDANSNVTVQRNTALDMRYSGKWEKCWAEGGPDTETRLNNILNPLVPQRDYVFIVLNEMGFAGCAGGGRLIVARSADFGLGSHEMGHMVGGLGDEYFDGTAKYTGAEPATVNQTKNTKRKTIKWSDFIDPATPIPTTCAQVADRSQDVGLFAGATIGQNQYASGLYRPHCDDRMTSNYPPFGPVNYNQIHKALDPYLNYTYDNAYAGDFNGDGRDDVVIHNANSLALYTSTGGNLNLAWINTGGIAGWQFTAGDQFYVGDFDGDAKDDLFVFNATNWSIPYFAMLRATGTGFAFARRFDQVLPGWGDMKRNDQFFVADFDRNSKDDLYVFNGVDHPVEYLEMLASTGSDLSFVRRFDGVLPGWQMSAHDQFLVADVNGDQYDDLYIFNGSDWSIPYLVMMRSTGNDLQYGMRFDGSLPGWSMKTHDQFFVANFDTDADDDLYVFNGQDWDISYLAMLRSSGATLDMPKRFDGLTPGWNLRGNDRFLVADVDGNRTDDLYVFNAKDWSTQYLGILRTSGYNLAGSLQKDKINSWDLVAADRFLVANFSGGSGGEGLFVRNPDYFGLLRSQKTKVQLNALHPWWIHDHRYHRLGWW